MYGFITEKIRNAVDRRCGFFCYARKIAGLITVPIVYLVKLNLMLKPKSCVVVG